MKKKIVLGLFALFFGLGAAIANEAPAGCSVSDCGGGNVKCCTDKASNTYFKR